MDKSSENGITKQQSLFLKGLAIWMMVYHHRFGNPGAISGYTSLLQFGSWNVELGLAWFCKLCVAIYAFVSGYGMFCSLSRNVSESSPIPYLRKSYCIVLKKLVSFYGQYWLVLLLYVLQQLFLYHDTLSAGEFLCNAAGLSCSYNGSWWYVLQYVKMMLLLPFISLFFSNMYSRRATVLKWVIPLGALALLGLLFPQWTWNALLWLNDFLRLCYLFSFIVGYLCARFCIFQRADRRLAGWKSGIRILAVLIVLIGCIALRVRLATVDSYVALDFILVALFSYCVLKAGAHLPHLTKFFAWFGARSTYMWLTHLFFFGPAFDAVTWLFRQSTWNYLTIMILSTLTAVLLEWLEKGIRAGGHRLMSCKRK